MATSDKADAVSVVSTPLRTLMLVLAVVAISYFAREVLLPFSLAVLLSFLLAPLTTRMQRWGLGRIGAVVVTVALAFSVIGGLGYVIVKNTLSVAADLPKHEQTLIRKVRALRKTGGSELSGAAKTMERIEEELVAPEEEAESAQEGGSFSLRNVIVGDEPLPVQIVDTSFAPLRVMNELAPLLTPLGSAAIVVVFVIFILLERENLRDRIIRLAGTSRVYVTTQALEDAARRVSKYLLMQLIINSIYGASVGVGLYFIGLPNAILWGLLATILRFLPYVGPIIAAVTPIALSMAVFEGWERPLITMALFIVAELVTNNVLEPWLYGTSTGVSTLAIVTAAVFWTWLWGPVGLVLATPLTVCLTVMARHVPQLAFLNVLLADEPPLELRYRFYQRLLAEDYEDADEVATEFLRNGSLEELYESMFVPALSLAERDRDAGRLTGAQESFIYESITELVEETHDEFVIPSANTAAQDEQEEQEEHEEHEETLPAQPPKPKVEPRRVLCLTLEDEADRIAAAMFAQLVAARGYEAEAVDAFGATEDVIRRLQEQPVDAVVVSAIAPGGTVRLRMTCRKLQRRTPNIKILIGLWNAPQRTERIKESLRKAGADATVATFKEAFDWIDETIPLRLPVPQEDQPRRTA